MTTTTRSPRRYRALSVTLASVSGLFLIRSCEPPASEPVAVAAPAPAPAPADAVLADALAQTNLYRAGNGVANLVWDERLAAAAARHSADQAAVATLTHTGSDGSSPKSRMREAGYPARWWAENAASGYPTANDVVWGWMNSPGHARNILNPSAVHVGIAVAYAADGTPFWTMDLGSDG
jgi:uncharacterized protein YkwD